MIKILIADDQRLFAESLKTVLEHDDPDIVITGVASNGKEAVAMAREDVPDLILMDVCMPVMNGVEAVQLIHEAQPDIKIIMLTTYDDDEYVYQSMRLGSSGYLLKDIRPWELHISIRAVLAGQVLLDASTVSSLMKHSGTGAKNPGEVPPPLKNLTKNEKQVLYLLSKGMSNIEIAKAFFLTHQTIKNYVSSIYAKLNVANRSQAIKLAIDYGDYLQRYFEAHENE